MNLTRIQRWFRNRLSAFVKSATYRTRRIDFYLNRSHENWRWLRVPGYSGMTIVLFLLLLFFLVYSPSIRWRGWDAVALVGGAGVATCCLAKMFARRRRLFLLQLIMLWLVVGFVWVIASGEQLEHRSSTYNHVFIYLYLGLFTFAGVLPPFFAQSLIAGYRDKFTPQPADQSFAELLRTTDLFFAPPMPRVELAQAILNVFRVPFWYPLVLTFFLAVVVLLVPEEFVLAVLPTVGLLWWLFLAICTVDVRFSQILNGLQRILFRGAPLIISLAVIGLAAARVLEFHYVATLLNSSPSTFIVALLLALYIPFWLYELWIGHSLSERLLPLLLPNSSARDRESKVPYPYAPSNLDPAYPTTTLHGGRVVQVHGSRLVVIGQFINPAKGGQPDTCWEFYDKVGLFDTLVYRGHRRGNVNREELAVQYGLGELRHRVQFYFLIVDLIVFATLLGLGLHFYKSKQDPIVRLEPTQVAKPKLSKESYPGLATTLIERSSSSGENRGSGRKRVILLAASGGGSRAALYTASTLRGLWELDAVEEVVLASGVSGGSAAICYFATHHEDLINVDNCVAWDRFADVMAAPFIEDVIRGTLETRVVGSAPMGTLLAESLERRFRFDASSEPFTLGQSPIGLIINTTLCAAADWNADDQRWQHPSPAGAGGRLIFTNLLTAADAFPKRSPADPQKIWMTWKVINEPSVSLTRAAALSANFPPVFSNAGVDVAEHSRYWVTDGGAADNRGILSLLYALKHALVEFKQLRPNDSTQPPIIHVIAADASAGNIDYVQDRGVGAALGASSQFASQLIDVLLDECRSIYEQAGGRRKHIYLHYLPMPIALRTRGGVGTHWMVSDRITLRDPRERDYQKATIAVLDKQTITDLIMDLHRTNSNAATPKVTEGDLATVQKWIAEDTDHDWNAVVHTILQREAD